MKLNFFEKFKFYFIIGLISSQIHMKMKRLDHWLQYLLFFAEPSGRSQIFVLFTLSNFGQDQMKSSLKYIFLSSFL